MTSYRFAYVTDVHAAERPPEMRRDDYLANIEAKCLSAAQIGIENKVEVWFDGGDLCHRPTQTLRELMVLARILRARGVPTKAVLGNHPIRGNYESWAPHSGLVLLASLLGPAVYEILHPTKADFDFHGCVIRLHHAQLVAAPVLWPHTLWKDYDAGPASVVLCSDYHPFQGSQTINGVTFLAPGAIGRGSLSEEDLNRVPRMVIGTVSRGRLVDHEFIELPHRPAAEVFDMMRRLDPVEVVKDQERLDAALESMQSANDLGATMAPIDVLRLVSQGLRLQRSDSLSYALDVLKKVS